MAWTFEREKGTGVLAGLLRSHVNFLLRRAEHVGCVAGGATLHALEARGYAVEGQRTTARVVALHGYRVGARRVSLAVEHGLLVDRQLACRITVRLHRRLARGALTYVDRLEILLRLIFLAVMGGERIMKRWLLLRIEGWSCH